MGKGRADNTDFLSDVVDVVLSGGAWFEWAVAGLLLTPLQGQLRNDPASASACGAGRVLLLRRCWLRVTGLQSQLEEGIQEVLTAAQTPPRQVPGSTNKNHGRLGGRKSWPPGVVSRQRVWCTKYSQNRHASDPG